MLERGERSPSFFLPWAGKYVKIFLRERVMKNSVIYNGITIEYELERKTVKNINLRIRRDLSVYVSAGSRVPLKRIEEFILSKAEFILNSREHYRKLSENVSQTKRYIDGEKIIIFGYEYSLKVTEGKSNTATIEGNEIILTVKNTEDYELKKRIIENKKRELCIIKITGICRKVYPEFKKYGIAFPELKFRKMTSKWGICRPTKGILTFNTALSEATVEAIYYVVVHEFTHFLEANHSKKFYDRLEAFMPDWKERKKLLERVSI